MLTKDGFVARNVTVIDFSNPQEIRLPDVYQPQSCVIKLNDRTIDIGSHCYATRKVGKDGLTRCSIKNCQGIQVTPLALDSLDTRRIALIKKLVEFGAEQSKSKSLITVYNNLVNLTLFFQFYFKQSDLDFSSPENRLHYAEAARRYSVVVKSNNKTGTAQKHRLTKVGFIFAHYLFDDVELNHFDYDIIPDFNQAKQCTTPLLPDEHELALAFRVAIFEGVYDLLINNKTLPFALNVPPQCGELNDTIWLGYSPWAGQCVFPRSSDFEKRQPVEWFDREAGDLFIKPQLDGHIDHISRESHKVQWAQIQKRLNKNNSDHSNLKQSFAGYAVLSILDLLLSMTGMNQQPAIDLPWYGGYFVRKAKQGHKTITLLKPEDDEGLDQIEREAFTTFLRSIKNRKQYQPVEVTISNRFLPMLERYLRIRNYYLEGGEDARLFPFSASAVNRRRDHLHKTFPEIPKLTAHVARASVSDNILSKTNDPLVAAQVLQNDPKTVIKHYAAGTQQGHIQGVGGYFNELGNQLKKNRKSTKNEIKTAAGGCRKNSAHPDPLPGAPIDPNCTLQEGCFFCKYYCVHADEIDIRKLVSILHYINRGATRAQNVDFFNQTFGLVIERINDLLRQIEAISEAKKLLTTRIKDEVFNHDELDHYWLQKLNRLEILTGDY